MRKFLFAFGLALLTITANATTCPENQFLSSNGICAYCIYNATCDGEQYKCIDGFYDTGNSECAACPPNSTCTSPDNFLCMPGAYMSKGACAVCPQNATCDGGITQPYCNPGYYKDKNNNCVSCAGHVCDGDKMVCCGPGYYLHSGGQCLRCSSTYYCPADECVVGITCDVGAYKDENGVCPRCEPGYYCPRGELKYTNRHTYCNIGYYRIGNVCEKCPDGTTCVGTYPDNMVCPDNLYLHDDGRCMPYAQNDPGIPGACNPGHYDTGTECMACPAASECTSDTDFSCNAGYWRNGNKCDICPDNSTCPQGSTQINCNPGYWLNNNNNCEICGSNGFWCKDNIRHTCPEYSADTVPLPDDYTVDSWNIYTYGSQTTSSMNGCSINISVTSPMGKYKGIYHSYKPQTSEYVLSNQSWLSANTGYYLDGATLLYYGIEYHDISACTNAPENSHYTGSGSPTSNDCPWVCNDNYMRNGDTCVTCPAGYQCIDGLLICPIGQYASGMTCIDCPSDYHDRAPDNNAPQSINQCQIKCDVGTYIASPNATTCTNVSEKYWNGVNYTNWGSVGTRNQCPDGLTTIGYGRGADSESDCGKTLHIGNYSLHLRSMKLTSPALAIQYGNRILYGDMSRDTRGKLRTEYNGAIYSAYNNDMD